MSPRIYCKNCAGLLSTEPEGDVIEVDRIQAIRPEPGDMVVITLSQNPDPLALQSLVEDLTDFWPENRVLILGEGASIQVVARSEHREVTMGGP